MLVGGQGEKRGDKRKRGEEIERLSPSGDRCLGEKLDKMKGTTPNRGAIRGERRETCAPRGEAGMAQSRGESRDLQQPLATCTEEKRETGERGRQESAAKKRKEDCGEEGVVVETNKMAEREEREERAVFATAWKERSRETKEEMRESEIKKELVLHVEIEGEEIISVIELLRAVELTCGRVLGCRMKGERKWELTMSNPRGKEKLLDGFKIRNSRITAAEIMQDTRVVSFLNLPLYITDNQIREKLALWGVEPASEIRRRKWPGTNIMDGTRFLKVKFPEAVSSLPYSTKFETVEGTEHFRILHDRQLKVCRLCLQPGHILRECPEFCCYRCKKQGHYARECAALEERRDVEVVDERGEPEEERTEAEDAERVEAGEGGSAGSEEGEEMEESEEEKSEKEEEMTSSGQRGGKRARQTGSRGTRVGASALEGESESRRTMTPRGRPEREKMPPGTPPQEEENGKQTEEYSGTREEDGTNKWTDVKKLRAPNRGKKEKHPNGNNHHII